MNEEQLIDILNKTRHERPHYKGIKTELLNLFSVSNCHLPDLTDVWNLADYLHLREQIMGHEKDSVFTALTEMEKENKCKLADLPDDVY